VLDHQAYRPLRELPGVLPFTETVPTEGSLHPTRDDSFKKARKQTRSSRKPKPAMRQIPTFTPSAPMHKHTVGYLARRAITGATNYERYPKLPLLKSLTCGNAREKPGFE